MNFSKISILLSLENHKLNKESLNFVEYDGNNVNIYTEIMLEIKCKQIVVNSLFTYF